MKDLETLKRLSKNPFYKMSDEEVKVLKDSESASKADESTEQEAPKAKKPVARSSKGNAAVKETGKLDKHSTDPVSE